MGEVVIKLGPHEHIIAVVPQPAAGPGWANAPTWVYIENGADGSRRCECIQPTERSAELHALYGVGATMHAALIRAVKTRKVAQPLSRPAKTTKEGRG